METSRWVADLLQNPSFKINLTKDKDPFKSLTSFMASSASPPQNHQEGVGDENVLQKHVAFFDRNNDGLVYPWETYQGFRALGRNIFSSALAAILINIGVSRKSRPGKGFSILFPIEVKNIHLAKHGSDTGAFDSQGRFVPSKFEEIFKKNAHTRPDALTMDELKTMLRGNREPKDYFGWANAYLDWKTLFDISKDKDGMLNKDTVRGLYDGTLFSRIEDQRSSQRKHR